MKDAACIVSISPIRSEASDRSEMVSQLLFGDCVQVVGIEHPWAEIIVLDDNYRGFVDHKHLQLLSSKEFRRWTDGLDYVYKRELLIIDQDGAPMYIPKGSRVPAKTNEFSIEKRKYTVVDSDNNPIYSIIDNALSYRNTPYLWGGKSPFGIDCSGLTQIVFRQCGYNLPRDAYEQVEYGSEVDYEDAQAGDLAFFINANGKVHHVGIIGANNTVIHASGHVRIDELKKNGIYRAETDEISHQLYRIMRL